MYTHIEGQLWQDANGNKITVPDGSTPEVVMADLNNPLPIETDKEVMLQDIDAKAGTVRSQYATPIPFQGEVYQHKEEEAKAYQADPNADTPYLTLEAAATGFSVQSLVDSVLGNSVAWRATSAKIEANRRKLKEQVRAATTHAELAAIDIHAGWS